MIQATDCTSRAIYGVVVTPSSSPTSSLTCSIRDWGAFQIMRNSFIAFIVGYCVFIPIGRDYLISICHPHPPDIALSLIFPVQCNSRSVHFQAGQRQNWKGNLAQDSLQTPQAHLLWSVNETRTINVHPLVSLCNFLYSSGTRVMQDRIGNSRRPCKHCDAYSLYCFGDSWYPLTDHSDKFRVDWAIPQTLSQTFAKDDAETIIAHVMQQVEGSAFWFIAPHRTTWDCLSQDVTLELPDGWTNDPW